MFTQLQNALKLANGRQTALTNPVKDELKILRHLVTSLASSTTLYLKRWGGGGCHSLLGEWNFWCQPFGAAIRSRLLGEENLK